MQQCATSDASSLHSRIAVCQATPLGAVANAVQGDFFRAVPVKDIKIGDFVRKISKDGLMQTKTFQRGEYDRSSKSYSLIDCDDVNREVFVKPSVMLAVGFTY